MCFFDSDSRDDSVDEGESQSKLVKRALFWTGIVVAVALVTGYVIVAIVIGMLS